MHHAVNNIAIAPMDSNKPHSCTRPFAANHGADTALQRCQSAMSVSLRVQRCTCKKL